MRPFPKTKIEKLLNLNLGSSIYDCGDARVFNLKKYNSRVIKIVTVTSEDTEYHQKNYKKLKTIISWAKKNSNPGVAKIFAFGKFKLSGIEYYYYVMEKLEKLPRKYQNERFSELICEAYLYDSDSQLIDFLDPKIKRFITWALEMPFKYLDCHSGNIMKNKNGNLKFVDLEGFEGE